MDAGIGDGAVAAPRRVRVDARHPADLARGAQEIEQFGIGRLGGEMIEIHIPALRNHKHMHRRLRADVVKGQGILGLQHGLVGDFAAQDTGEDVAVVVAVGHVRPQSEKR